MPRSDHTRSPLRAADDSRRPVPSAARPAQDAARRARIRRLERVIAVLAQTRAAHGGR